MSNTPKLPDISILREPVYGIGVGTLVQRWITLECEIRAASNLEYAANIIAMMRRQLQEAASLVVDARGYQKRTEHLVTLADTLMQVIAGNYTVNYAREKLLDAGFPPEVWRKITPPLQDDPQLDHPMVQAANQKLPIQHLAQDQRDEASPSSPA